MKRGVLFRFSALTLLFAIITISLASCSFIYKTEDYMTREEVEDLIGQSMIGDVTVEGGDNYDITIQGGSAQNLAAAAKGLLSTVTVTASFDITYTSMVGNTSTKTAVTSGSGVIYSLDKYSGDAIIITNYHVIYDYRSDTANRISDRIYVELYGQESGGYEIPATYIGGSMAYDLALIKVSGSRLIAESAAMPAEFAPSGDVSVLDTAIAIGNPASGSVSDSLSVTLGHVNVESEYVSIGGADGLTEIAIRVMRIDTAVNYGNSGGGLYGSDGRLIGIVNAKMSGDEVENIGYAIPSDLVKYITENILYYCLDKDCESVMRCMLGITVAAENHRAEYDTESGRITRSEDVLVSVIEQNSAAAGTLEVGDRIISVTIDGAEYPITRTFHAVECMLNARVGSEIVIEVERDGEAMSVTLSASEDMLKKW